MTGYVCSVASAKGGVGKTTTAANVGATLAADGHEVVVVDADLEMPNLGELLGLDPAEGIHSVLAGELSVGAATRETPPGMTVLPGEPEIEAYADADPSALREVLGTLRAEFDVVLVDTAPGLAHETAVPVGLADGVLLVTTPDAHALADAEKTVEFADRVDGDVLSAVVTQVARAERIDPAFERLNVPVQGVVPVDHDATVTEPLVLEAPGSDAAAAYHDLGQSLAAVFVDGEQPADGEVVFDQAWFEDADATTVDEARGGSFEMFE